MEYTEIRIAGVNVKVPSAQVDGRTVIITGGWLKIATVHDEDYQGDDVVLPSDRMINDLRERRDLGVDIFTFSQKPADTSLKFPFYHEWDSVAAVPITSFSDWWDNRISSYLRRDIRKAAKQGVVVRSIPLDDNFLRGVVEIYDETPIRQGRPFWHFKKGFDAVKMETETYAETSEFLGAYLGDELIGFLKVVYVGRMACLMAILSKIAHQDKKPTNSLIAKLVEICEAKGCSHLIYGKYRYDDIDSSLTTFKHRNGFQEILVPKYYVPLTLKGRAALGLHLQHGLRAWVPRAILQSLRNVRAFAYRHLQPARSN